MATLLDWFPFTRKRRIADQIRALGELSCPACQKAYGTDTAHKTHDKFLSAWREFEAHHPGTRAPAGAFWKVLCPQCGAKAFFLPDNGSLNRPPSAPTPNPPSAP